MKGSICKLKNLERQQNSLGKLLRDVGKIQEFQNKIYQKAKQEKDYKFYILIDKIISVRFLHEAYLRCKANRGSAGIDKIDFDTIEAQGEDKFVYELRKELKDKTYKPSPVKRVYIEKANGKLRPLGIPTIKDRVVQMSCKLVIEPIFEADFEECSYGFRPKKSAHGAVAEIKKNLKLGNTAVLDADLSSYFDTIPHDKLMKLVALRISDIHTLNLIKSWLKAPVSENGKLQSVKKNKIGTPQGGVISPLLANIYLNLMDKIIVDKWTLFRNSGIKVVRYADDFVLMGKEIKDIHIEKLKALLENMGLNLNEEKTKVVIATEEKFDFLGFSFRYDKSRYKTYEKFWNVIPIKNSENKARHKLKEYFENNGHLNPWDVSEDLNSKIRGLVNYYSIENVSYPNKFKRNLKYYLRNKLNRYYKRKSQRSCKLYNKRAYEILKEKYGLIEITDYKKLAKA